MTLNEIGKYFFVLMVLKQTNLVIGGFNRDQCYPTSARDPHEERAFSGRRYIVSKPGGTNGKVEGFRKLEGGVHAFCGRRYIVLGPGGMQDTAERLEKLTSTLRGRLADGDMSSRSLGDPWRGGRVQAAGG